MWVLEIFGPEAYWGGWLVIATICLLAALLIPLVIIWWHRPRKRSASITAVGPAAARRRNTALAAIDAVEREHAAGSLSARDAHLELSRIVRVFIAEETGEPVAAMTAHQLRDRFSADPRFGELAGWEQILQPPKFALNQDREVPRGAAEARRLVTAWR